MSKHRPTVKVNCVASQYQINQRTVTKRCRWRAYTRKAMAAAREYAADMTDKVNVRVVTLRE